MLGIIILNYNNATSTISCIESVVRYNTYPSKYIIVDNASTDDSVSVLTEYLTKAFGSEFSNCTDCTSLDTYNLVVADNNGGYAKGNNVGLSYIEDDKDIDYVMVLNNDILFTEDIIPSLIRGISLKADAGIISPLLYKKDGKTIDYSCARESPSNKSVIYTFLLQYRDINGYITKQRNACRILQKDPDLLNEEMIPIGLPSGSCMLIQKALFKDIGWFDPNTFLYYEENILYQKLKAIGRQNYLMPIVSCIHLGAQSTSKSTISFLKVKEAKSAQYYLNTYADMSFYERMVSVIAFKTFFLRDRVAKMIRKIKSPNNSQK